MDGAEDHDEVSELDGLAVGTDDVVELLEGLAAGDHVDDVDAHLHDQLLRDDDPEAELVAEGVLPQLVVPIEPLPRHHLVHLHHLPQSIQGDDPRQNQHSDARSPARSNTWNQVKSQFM